MVDMHCHILPSVDDGASSLTESILMAREAKKQGIRKIIATPHHQNGTYINSGEDIKGIVEFLNGQLQIENIPVEILPGQETRIYGEILIDLQKGDVITLNGDSDYVLIEFPESQIPHYTTQLLFDMQMAGYTPIIAHPERNHELLENPDKLYRLVKNGALTQIKAGSLVGKVGKKVQGFAWKMLEYNLAHFIASAAHDSKKRGFYLQEAFQQITRMYGSAYSYQLQENSESILTGQPINRDMPERMITQKKLWHVFRR